ncbi:type IV secretion system DNA-binding domain-containing protein [Candidatus Kaiserbacteria bacterium]|nr:type IV secretion system DNA-binding domain-containing protein [Candidatus Kaiserbacteria bacterium]
MPPDHSSDDRRVTYFAATHTRGKREMFGIRGLDRGKHIYVIGKTGMGKSTMLENMAIQDIQNGEGLAFIDPHGSTAEKLLDFIPQERINDVVYFAPFDTDHPIGFNVMEDVGFDKRHLVVSGLMGALKRIWVDAWSARMEYILQNTLLALLEYPDSTLLDVNRMLTNKAFRATVIEKITDPIVRSFWTEEFATYTDRYTQEATPAIQNKIGQFTANPLIRNIVGQAHSSFDLRQIMDDKKIFIVNLSKGRMGETNASLLGSMLTVKIYLAAMSRADESAARMVRLPRFYFYVDEFQSMMNEAFADILSESRKYKLALTLANQYIEQMEEKVRDAVFGNIGTLIVFRVGPFDAEVLETVFQPTFQPEDLVGLGIGQIYLTLMIDGVGSPPFSAETIPPIEAPSVTYRDDVVTRSRASYGRERAEIESVIHKKQADFAQPPKEKRPPREFGRPDDGSMRRDERRDDRPRMQIQSRPPSYERQQGVPRDAAPVTPSPQREVVERNSLRDAIEKARSAREAAPAKSPIDIMRGKQARPPLKDSPPPRPVLPAQRGEHAHAQKPEPPHPEPVPRPHREEVPRHEHRPPHAESGEISPHELARVLNSRERDADDL